MKREFNVKYTITSIYGERVGIHEMTLRNVIRAENIKEAEEVYLEAIRRLPQEQVISKVDARKKTCVLMGELEATWEILEKDILVDDIRKILKDTYRGFKSEITKLHYFNSIKKEKLELGMKLVMEKPGEYMILEDERKEQQDRIIQKIFFQD